MNLVLVNGTAEQQGVVAHVVNDLLNLSLDPYQFTWTVSFAPNPVADPRVHHPFAITSFDGIGSCHSIFRDDFPHFADQDPQYGDILFAQETVAHELGHACSFQLPSDRQGQVAGLFKTTPSTWEPTDKEWPDRPFEGIAETFKDAFLRNTDREFTNRTNEQIPIYEYAALRKIYRISGVAVDPYHRTFYGGPQPT